jgi:hypothetical protein
MSKNRATNSSLMKTLFNLAMLSLMFLICCNEPFEISTREKQGGENNTRFDRPQTIFEGEWLWVKTEGEGIAGPYISDSTSTGYSLRCSFDWNTVIMSKRFLLSQSILDLIERTEYDYSYTISDDSTSQVLNLSDRTGYSEKFLWTITTEEKDGRPLVMMTLRSIEPCCDNSFIHYFVGISENIIEPK